MTRSIFGRDNLVQYRVRLRWCWCTTNTFIRVPPLKFTVTADDHDADWECHVDFFAKLLARDWSHNLRSYFSVRCLWPLSRGGSTFVCSFKHVLKISWMKGKKAIFRALEARVSSSLKCPGSPELEAQVFWARYTSAGLGVQCGWSG